MKKFVGLLVWFALGAGQLWAAGPSCPIRVNQAVIAAAGLGTRFMPFTKSVPKEMVTVLDKPAIHYIVEECVASGIKDFTFVVSDGKAPLRHYLAHDIRLEDTLARARKGSLLDTTNRLIYASKFSYVDQGVPRGTGHAILCAREQITADYFAVLYPDDLLVSDEEPGLQQLIEVAQKHGGAVMALMEVPMDQVSAYGVVRITEEFDDGVVRIGGIVEKPKRKEAPSNVIAFGRYIVPRHIFNYLETLEPGIGGELQFTDALGKLIDEGFPVFGYRIRAKRFDLGIPRGWLQANIYLALRDQQYAMAVQSIVTS